MILTNANASNSVGYVCFFGQDTQSSVFTSVYKTGERRRVRVCVCVCCRYSMIFRSSFSHHVCFFNFLFCPFLPLKKKSFFSFLFLTFFIHIF